MLRVQPYDPWQSDESTVLQMSMMYYDWYTDKPWARVFNIKIVTSAWDHDYSNQFWSLPNAGDMLELVYPVKFVGATPLLPLRLTYLDWYTGIAWRRTYYGTVEGSGWWHPDLVALK